MLTAEQISSVKAGYRRPSASTVKNVSAGKPTDDLQIESLTGCSDHLLFLTNVIQRSELSPAEQTALSQRIERIRQRCADPNLYLAVIGEFSSGKSTFINALLRDELLETSVRPTTAAATKIKFGEKLEAHIVLKDAQKPRIKASESTKRINNLSFLPELDVYGIRKLIHAATTDKKIATQVSEITISHPAPFLSEGIVVIDTPGKNAIEQEHGEITKHIVEHVADAAVVIIPAIIPLSISLVSFLNGSLQPYLHRCVFVVTRMDEIAVEEQDELLEDIRQRLTDRLGIASPTLLPCSAQVVVDELKGTSISAPLRVWDERFTEMEGIIFTRLQRERALSVAERILRLLTETFDQLNLHLAEQIDRYQKREKVLAQETIRDLAEFKQEQLEICDQMLTEGWEKVGEKIQGFLQLHIEETQRAAVETLAAVANKSQLKTILEGSLKNLFDRQHEKLVAQLNAFLSELPATAAAVGKYFDEIFQEQYKRLAVIQAESSSPQIVQISKKADLSFTPVAAAMEINKVFETTGVLDWLFDSLIGPSLDERKQMIWEKLVEGYEAYFETVMEKAGESFDATTDKVLSALQNRIDAYTVKYEAIVNQMRSEQQREQEHCRRLQATVSADSKEINRRREKLQAQQQRLSRRTSIVSRAKVAR